MNRTDAEIERLATRLADERSRRVVFVSHCLLNQNVRYLGGAWAAGIAPDAVGQFIREGVGLCQMPCPEQAAWGGVMKRFILRFYGAQDTWAYRFCGLLLPVFRLYTRAVYRRLASRTARHIADYARSGFQVIGIVGVGDSPSCGVLHTLNINRSLQAVASIDLNGIDRQTFNERAIQACVVEGEGLYIKALRRQLGRRGLTVPFLDTSPPRCRGARSRLARSSGGVFARVARSTPSAPPPATEKKRAGTVVTRSSTATSRDERQSDR